MNGKEKHKETPGLRHRQRQQGQQKLGHIACKTWPKKVVGWSEISTLKKGISGHYFPMNCLVHGKICQTWFQINM